MAIKSFEKKSSSNQVQPGGLAISRCPHERTCLVPAAQIQIQCAKNIVQLSNCVAISSLI